MLFNYTLTIPHYTLYVIDDAGVHVNRCNVGDTADPYTEGGLFDLE